MTEDTSELAKQLVVKFRPYGVRTFLSRETGSDCWGTHCLTNSEVKSFMAISKFVQRMVIESNIKTLENIPTGMFDSTPYVKEMIAELTAELARLDGGK